MNKFFKMSVPFLLLVVLSSGLFATPIDTTWGYGALQWGSTQKEAKNAGFILRAYSTGAAKSIAEDFSEPVEFFTAFGGKDNFDVGYYQKKLFCAIEVINFPKKGKKLTEKDCLAALQSKFPRLHTESMGNALSDEAKDEDGNITRSVTVSINYGRWMATVTVYDWKVYREIESSGRWKISAPTKTTPTSIASAAEATPATATEEW